MHITKRSLAIVAAATLVVVAVTVRVLTDTRSGGPVELSVDGEAITKDNARVGATYNFGVLVRTTSDPARLVSARMRDVPDGLTPLEPLLGATCDGNAYPSILVGDLTRDPTMHLAPLTSRTVERDASGRYCSYVLMRFVPTTVGLHQAHDVEIRYRTGSRTYLARVHVTFGVDAVGFGPEPAEADYTTSA